MAITKSVLIKTSKEKYKTEGEQTQTSTKIEVGSSIMEE